MSDPIVCKTCGFHGESENDTKGSFGIEVILWLCFIIPGLIYSLWRLSTRRPVCPKCSSSEIIPIDSPLGNQLMRKIAPEAAISLIAPYRPTTGRRGGLAWRIGKFIAKIKSR